MRIIKLLTGLSVLFAFSFLVLTSCNTSTNKTEEKQQISILYPNWAEGIAFTHLAKVALDEHGYDVKITPIEPGIIYASLAKGDADLFFDAWLPHLHKHYWDKYGEKLDKVGESFSNGTTGLVVPSYLDISSIEELNDNKDVFDGKIIGIGSGAGIHKNTENAIEAYDLDYKQITSSGPAMVASLQKAYGNEDPIIITGWKPHYIWGQYDLKYLEDPKGVYTKDVCAILARKGFKEEFPGVNTFAGNFNLPEKKLYDLMGRIKDSGDAMQSAIDFYAENKEMVDAWFPAQK